MDRPEIRNVILRHISPKLERVGISTQEIGNGFDLVRSGLVNSLEFVDLVAFLEKELGCEIDFERALEKGNLTTLGGLIHAIKEARHE